MSELVRFLRYSETPHRLHSGGESTLLIDAHAIYACEPLREFIISTWVNELNLGKQSKGVTIYGVPTGGTPWAMGLSERLGIEWCGFKERLSGVVWVVDDVVTTGKSILDVSGPFVIQKRMAVVDRGHNSRIYCVWRMPLP